MINIEKFIKLRKKAKISQASLSKGICTQATLSRFENDGKIPTFKILHKLCNRLKIEVGDITISSINNKTTQALIRAEYAFNNYDYTQIQKLLTSIEPDTLIYNEDKLHFIYLHGMYLLKDLQDPMSAIFYFEQILKSSDASSIYYLLALSGCGQAYEKTANNDNSNKAKDFYEQILEKIGNFQITDDLTTFQALNILWRTGDFYGRNDYYRKSNAILRYAYQIGSNQKVVYFMAPILYRLGSNNVALGFNERARQNLLDARAFARFNHDQTILTKANQILNDINTH